MRIHEQDSLAPPAPSATTNVYVARRKDGRYKAVYCFASRRITQIRTLSQLQADAQTGSLQFVGIDATLLKAIPEVA